MHRYPSLAEALCPGTLPRTDLGWTGLGTAPPLVVDSTSTEAFRIPAIVNYNFSDHFSSV